MDDLRLDLPTLFIMLRVNCILRITDSTKTQIIQIPKLPNTKCDYLQFDRPKYEMILKRFCIDSLLNCATSMVKLEYGRAGIVRFLQTCSYSVSEDRFAMLR